MINAVSQNTALQGISAIAPQKAEPKAPDKKEASAAPAGSDELVNAEENTPIGLYGIEKDENGNPSLFYDKPEEKPEADPKETSPERSEEEPKSEKSGQTTTDTDKVDREIERLRQKQEQLQSKLNKAEGKESENIARQLDKVNAELAMKDNDSYRRQHAVIS